MKKMPSWLKDAVFYEIYPQSFYDSNDDGIGDINGITAKLDYIAGLGFNALWINPCFVSPFKDAGYDVEDYYTVAPRYGTNEDLYRLFDEAHKKGIHVLLDLVPGHTSDQCEWFKQSALPDKNEYSDRYVWTKSAWNRPEGYSWVAGNADRDGCYMLNFFLSQPALNYGFNKITHPDWQLSYTDERAQATFDEMLNVMRFWLDHGCDGFRVDMADSLVKNDEDKTATASLWRRARKMLDENYPEAVLVSEWCNAPRSINMAGFHCDFMLNHWHKLLHYASRFIDEKGENKSYFCKTAHVSAENMLNNYLKELAETRDNGYICIISGNHDTPRVSYTLEGRELELFYVFLLTMPGAPFIYYGDEIGMRYVENLVSVEGGYGRTGSRTPMQWDDSVNAGFSAAPKEKLYIPMDEGADRPTVASQMAKEDSLYHEIQKLIHIRKEHTALCSNGEIEFIYAQKNSYPFAYMRTGGGERILVIVNPANRDVSFACGFDVKKTIYRLGGGISIKGGEAFVPACSACFFEV